MGGPIGSGEVVTKRTKRGDTHTVWNAFGLPGAMNAEISTERKAHTKTDARQGCTFAAPKTDRKAVWRCVALNTPTL